MVQGCHLQTWLPVILGILLLDPKVRLGGEASVTVLQKWTPLEGESIVRSFQSLSDLSTHRSFHDIPHPWPKKANSSLMLFHLCCWQPQFLGQLSTPAGKWVDVWGQEKTHQVLTTRLSLRA